MENEIKKFKCEKCGSLEYEVGQLRAPGDFFNKFFNIQNLKFNTLSCKKCGYTEIYKDGKKRIFENVVDFFGN